MALHNGRFLETDLVVNGAMNAHLNVIEPKPSSVRPGKKVEKVHFVPEMVKTEEGKKGKTGGDMRQLPNPYRQSFVGHDQTGADRIVGLEAQKNQEM